MPGLSLVPIQPQLELGRMTQGRSSREDAVQMLDRRGGKTYWYTYTRRSGKVRRVYVAAGQAAHEAARALDEKHRQRDAQRQEVQQVVEESAEADGALEYYSLAIDLVTKATLTRLGFHQHLRGDWRLRRGKD